MNDRPIYLIQGKRVKDFLDLLCLTTSFCRTECLFCSSLPPHVLPFLIPFFIPLNHLLPKKMKKEMEGRGVSDVTECV